MTETNNDVCKSAFFDRLGRIKTEYRHFHHILKMCYLLQQMASQLTAKDLDIEPVDPRTISYCPWKPNDAYSRVLNGWLDLIETTRLSLSYHPDVVWVCNLTAKLFEAPLETMERRARRMAEYTPVAIDDPQIADFINNVQTVLIKFAHDDDVVAICGFLDDNLPKLYFPDGEDSALWRPSALQVEDDWHEEQAINKVEHAFYFFDQVEEEFPINPEITWICELSRKIIDLLPAIGDSLDGFANGPYVENWEEEFEDATV
jgi:hypothetical protein